MGRNEVYLKIYNLLLYSSLYFFFYSITIFSIIDLVLKCHDFVKLTIFLSYFYYSTRYFIMYIIDE